MAVSFVIAAIMSAIPPTTEPAANGQSGGDTSGPAPSDVVIDMVDVRFDPAEVVVKVGTTVTWVNKSPIAHTVTPTDKALWGTQGSGDDVSEWVPEGATWRHTFTEIGRYTYYCIPHASKAADGTFRGMVGVVIVTADGKAPASDFVLPERTVVPSPVAPGVKAPDADGVVRFELTTHEVVAQIDDNAAYGFWTFDGTVPGPMLRVRQGDTVEIRITNPADSKHAHNIDLHAVTGPGGGAAVTNAAPGESKAFRFKALNPGVYIYHCATPHVPTHIANGMYGMIVVEPEGGYAPVDHEYYIVQGEVYTAEPHGTPGLLSYSLEKLFDEEPEYVLFNGRVGALTGDGAPTARVGDTVRVFFGVGGGIPSSFHLIGEIFDRVYMDGETHPSVNRQTILVPAAGSAVVEFGVEYPGTYVFVDHTLSRTFDKGALGLLVVSGEADAEVYAAA